jgi:cytochrome P450
VSDRATFLDIEAPGFAMHSPEAVAAREQHWYARTPYGIGVLRHDDIAKLMKDPRLIQGSVAWPAHNGVTRGPFAEWWSRILLCREGVDHARLRKLVNPAFAPRTLAPLQPAFERLAHEVIDSFASRGSCEFMTQFAEPYATRVLTLLLGIPDEDWRMIADWAAELGIALGVRLRQEQTRVEAALASLFDYAERLITTRRAALADDFLSQLVAASEDGDRLSDQELRDMVVLLIFGGIDTTRNQLSLGIKIFLEHPEQWELLAQEPALARNAVEEIMRLVPTTTWVSRQAAVDFTYRDLDFKAGMTVHLFAAVAGSDPTTYENPDFDLTARRAPHHGFGGGIHYCLGHAVARSDMAVAFTALSARLTHLRLNGAAVWLPDSGNTGAEILTLGFDLRG